MSNMTHGISIKCWVADACETRPESLGKAYSRCVQILHLYSYSFGPGLALKHSFCCRMAKVCFKRGWGVWLKHTLGSTRPKTCFNEAMSKQKLAWSSEYTGFCTWATERPVVGGISSEVEKSCAPCHFERSREIWNFLKIFPKSFGGSKKVTTFAVPFGNERVFNAPTRRGEGKTRSLKRLKGKYKQVPRL